MELKEYISIIKKRLLLIIVITLFSTFISAVYSYFIVKPVYKADISVIIGRFDKEQNVSYNDILMYQRQVKTYSKLARSRAVAEDTIRKLRLDMKPNELLSMVSVSPEGDTEFITIAVRSQDPKQAKDIANQFARSLKQVSKEVRHEDNVILIDEALLPTRPDSPRPKLNMAIAFFMGMMISLGLVFLMEYLDNTIKTQDDVEKLVGIPVIGTIPLVEDEE
jgi:capsular polysaccharide biosynthesis protein